MTKDQVAPGRLDRVRRFVNTAEFEEPSDQLGEAASGLAWLETFGYSGSFSHDDLAKLRDFREAIRGVLLANAGDGDVGQAWATLASFGPAPLSLEFGSDANPRLRAAVPSGEEAVRAELSAIIYDAVRDGSWHRLKACRKDTCLWAYYDHSKNGSGAWCNMATCGNQMKARRRRSRARE
jgi:predicted RNA-binding Zn ribbon-like protein